MKAAAGELPMLALYRAILKAARHFPSVKRERIIANIKAEFRENRALADPDKLAHARAVAERGLSDLRAYMVMSGGEGGAMSIHLKGASS